MVRMGAWLDVLVWCSICPWLGELLGDCPALASSIPALLMALCCCTVRSQVHMKLGLLGFLTSLRLAGGNLGVVHVEV